MKLLCIVDMQRGFMTPETHRILPKVINLVDYFYLQNDLVVFTKFHNTSDSPYCDFLGWRDLQYSSDQALLPEFEIYTQRVFVKYGYSIFTKAMSNHIEAQKVSEIYLAGLDTDACIYESALQAFDRHIQPIVIQDACMSSAGAAHHAAALTLLKRQIGEHNIRSTLDVMTE